MAEQNIPVKQISGESAGQSNTEEIALDTQYPYFKARPASLGRSFDSFIAEQTKGFVVRKFVIDELEEFLGDEDIESGYFIIKGEPGIGKSALMAYLVKTNGYIHHFNIGLQNISKTQLFLESVCAQLILRFELDHPSWPPDADKDGAFLNQLLDEAGDKLKDNDKLVIVVDALDEVDRGGLSPRANILYLPPVLPPHVYIVVSTREKDDIHLQVANSKEFRLLADSTFNIRDARDYIRQKLSDKQMLQRIASWNTTDEQFIDAMLQKSAGNFMYLRHVLPAIKAGRFVEGTLDQLPEGLLGYYRCHWRQMRNQDQVIFDTTYQPVVCVLAAVKEAVSIDQASAFTGITANKVRDVIKEWREFLYEETGDQHQYLYRVYHKSFQDFLREEVDPQLKTYHGMIARYYLRLAGKDIPDYPTLKGKNSYNKDIESSQKILILASNPKGTPNLRLDKEVREIEEILRQTKYRNQFEFCTIWAVRPRDIRKALLDVKPHIVHFIGHGNEKGLLVEDEIGFAVNISTEALVGLFALFSNKVECVILSACNSSIQANAIKEHIKYVIGMEGLTKDNVAIEFALGFYDALAAGRSYDDAFEFGRNAILTKFPKEKKHLIPVLKQAEI
ncbi:MAG: hypothetical protein QG657_2173 [Acidobacteriota bacterium]|nr:hypothetical protein [Acidobacteriota bacterium]